LGATDKPRRQLPREILPKFETESASKRQRKPASKFDDFVVEKSSRKLIVTSDLKKAGQQDDVR
jgi:hypothetical protein